MPPRRSRNTDPEMTPLKLFGSEVRRFREMADLSQDQTGSKTHVTGSFIGAIERGETRCQRSLAVKLDEILDTRGTLPSLWDKLVMNAAFPIWFDWPKIEAEATRLQSYEPLVVYGLLQTEGYANALLYGDRGAVAARLGRQAIMTREDPPPPQVAVILNEAVLHYQVGDKQIMREQLEYLIAANSSTLSIHILPNGAAPPANRSASFVLATLPDLSQVAYVDTAARGMTLGSNEDIHAIAGSFEALRSHAFPVDMSMDLIRRTVEERWV